MEVSQPLDHVTHAVISANKTIDFGISNSAEFFDILSRTLYTDQILAVVREVLCNAWDAHIAAGCTNRAIEITLDSEHFMVRDYGHGIRQDDIGPIYGVYGNSTKKNDGQQTGGFGLGCKAPFAYTDHFEVISHHVGKKTIYNMSKSNAVAKGKPGIITIASFPTDETGLRVKMPIQQKDWTRFKEVIRRVVENGEMKATLNGELLKVLPFSKAENGFLLTTEYVLGLTKTRNILLRYGNVIYPIEPNDELLKLHSDVSQVMKRFENHKLVLQAPPDSISVTPSRESLSMQEHTINTLQRLFKNFLAYTKTLDNEILIQGKKLVDAAVAEKNYSILFGQGWGFSPGRVLIDAGTPLTDLASMARYQLTRNYPDNVQFRLQDVDYRIRKAAEAKIVDTHLATTLLVDLPTAKTIPGKYAFSERKNTTDWLSRRVIGKVMSKLLAKNMDDGGLYVIDRMQPGRSYHPTALIPAREATVRNPLINLPFLRKVVVVTTAITKLEERLRIYTIHNPGMPRDGVLCYHVRSRKAGSGDEALKFFTKLGYEIIDFTKRHSWEQDERKPVSDRKKAEPYAGLPALSNILTVNKDINTSHYRGDDAVKLPKPDLVLIIGARSSNLAAIEGYTTKATRALVKLYGDRCGVARDQVEYKRAIKHGARDFQIVLEAEMEAMLLHSPTVIEYWAYDYKRMKENIHTWVSNMPALGLIYQDRDLRKEFGLTMNLSDEEEAMVDVYNYSSGLSDDCTSAIRKFVGTIPLAPENETAKKAVTGNEMLGMLDIPHVKTGLRSSKRQIYLDIFAKVLKG